MPFENLIGKNFRCTWNEWGNDDVLDDTHAVCLMCDNNDETLEDLLKHMMV